MILAQMLKIVALNDLASMLCARKFSFVSRGIYPKKYPFLAKMVLFSLYLQIAHQILMIFAQMLEIVALSDLASVLCARKFSFAPMGDSPPNYPPFI